VVLDLGLEAGLEGAAGAAVLHLPVSGHMLLKVEHLPCADGTDNRQFLVLLVRVSDYSHPGVCSEVTEEAAEDLFSMQPLSVLLQTLLLDHFVTDITRDELPVLGYDVIVVLGLVSLQLPGVREPFVTD